MSNNNENDFGIEKLLTQIDNEFYIIDYVQVDDTSINIVSMYQDTNNNVDVCHFGLSLIDSHFTLQEIIIIRGVIPGGKNIFTAFNNQLPENVARYEIINPFHWQSYIGINKTTVEEVITVIVNNYPKEYEFLKNIASNYNAIVSENPEDFNYDEWLSHRINIYFARCFKAYAKEQLGGTSSTKPGGKIMEICTINDIDAIKYSLITYYSEDEGDIISKELRDRLIQLI